MKIESLLCIFVSIILIVILLAVVVRFSVRGGIGSWNCETDGNTNHCCYRFQNFCVRPLVSDIPGIAPLVNDNVINPWGIVSNRKDISQMWVAENGAGLLTLLTKDKGTQIQSVIVPAAPSILGNTGSPSGLVTVPESLRDENAFLISSPDGTGPAELITVTEDGLICAFNTSSVNAVTIVDNSAANAVYKGCDLTSCGGGRLYACNFFSNRVEVYDAKWNLETTISDTIMLSLGYAPFNVKIDKNAVYVAFALQNSADHGEQTNGAGNGFILVYDLNGVLLRRLVNRGVLNSPWGMVILKQHLFVTNVGDGTVNVFDRCTGRYIGSLLTKCNTPIIIEGLKGILQGFSFHHNKCGSCKDGFLFTAGINGETSGLIGCLKR